MKANFKSIIIIAILVSVIIVGSSFIMENTGNEDKFTYSDLVILFKNDLVKEFIIDENDVIIVTAYVPDESGEPKLDESGKPVEAKLEYNKKLTL